MTLAWRAALVDVIESAAATSQPSAAISRNLLTDTLSLLPSLIDLLRPATGSRGRPSTLLLALDALPPHQECLARGLIRAWAPEMHGKVIFISHQWTGFKEPDASNEQCRHPPPFDNGLCVAGFCAKFSACTACTTGSDCLSNDCNTDNVGAQPQRAP